MDAAHRGVGAFSTEDMRHGGRGASPSNCPATFDLMPTIGREAASTNAWNRVTDVSVLTPSFGYGRFIADGIESVIRQRGVNLEHIVQDAGSDDETLDVLRSFDDRVQWTSEARSRTVGRP